MILAVGLGLPSPRRGRVALPAFGGHPLGVGASLVGRCARPAESGELAGGREGAGRRLGHGVSVPAFRSGLPVISRTAGEHGMCSGDGRSGDFLSLLQRGVLLPWCQAFPILHHLPDGFAQFPFSDFFAHSGLEIIATP